MSGRTKLTLVALAGLTLVRLLVPGPQPDRSGRLLCRLEADPRNMFTRVPAARPRARLRAFEASASTITVTYTGFTPEAQNAFQYAVDLWQAQLTSPVAIHIDARFADLGPTTLGQAGATFYYRDFTRAIPATYYPKALANSLNGSELDASYSDIQASFSSTFAWYYGTDGATQMGTYDFVSVVLHELAHGLGFAGSMDVNAGIGSWGLGGYPIIYDRFVENGSGQALLDTVLFPNSSTALAAQLTGGSLYWNGLNGIAATGSRPHLYAPATWMDGSSYSHLDEATYPAGDPNSLMTYAIGAAESIHDPGAVVRGMFADEGWSSCSYSVSPTSESFGVAGGTGSIAVTAGAGCAWTATVSAGWIAITGGTSGTGNGTVTYSVAANVGVPRAASISVAGQTVTVTQASPLPTLTADPTVLHYGAVTSGGTLTALTPSQDVTLTQSGSGSVTWTATASQPWIEVVSGSGAGSGRFSVRVVNSGGLPATGTVTGSVTVTATGAQSSPAVTVYLTLYGAGATAAPFGQVDTPVQNVTGVTGSIGVTGWALDDVGISSVKLYRNCLAFEPQANCQWIGGLQVVYMGDADVVPGARPDVEATYPSYPQAYRAGWGYLLLTNLLPHLPNELMYGGQGAIAIYALATDVDGHQQWLGRTVYDQTPTTITMANDTAVKPFGAIDTPGQGQTVSGAFWNFGWALTPDTNTTAGAGDIEIPTTGGTMWVWIDGAPVGTVLYNLCRGTVGSPVPADRYCDDDVASIFGNPTPQAFFTPRSANPTKYRNLDLGRGAIGAYYVDTTGLANGRHSIVWGVTDSAGRVDGIGSRDFLVLNGGSLAAAGGAALALEDAAAVAWRPVGGGPVWGRTGFAPQAPWEAVEADAVGTRHVRIPQLGRLELALGAGVTAGYLEANGTLRRLPAGSRLAAGRFTWAPPAGYFGTYALVFLAGIERVPVRVTIDARGETPRVEGYVDLPRAGQTVSGAFTVAGWAADRTAWHGTGVGAVHVWAFRRDVSGVAPTFLGAAAMGAWRPDVGAQLGIQFERAGWRLVAPALPPGDYDVVAYFWSTRTGHFEAARSTRAHAR